MKKIFILIGISFLISLISYSQENGMDQYEGLPEISKTYNLKPVDNYRNSDHLNRYLKNYQLYELNFADLNNFAKAVDYTIKIDLKFTYNNYLITMQKNDLSSHDYCNSINGQILYDKASSVNSEIVDTYTYKGYVNGNIEDIVRFTIDNSKLTGFIHNEKENSWLFFDSYNHFINDSNNMNKNLLIIYDMNDIINVNESNEDVVSIISKAELNKIDILPCQPLYLKIATEADYEYWSKYGSNTNYNILSILNQVEGVFSRYFNLMFVVTYQNYWNNSADPYNSDIAESRLVEFRNYWNNKTINSPKNISMMFTGLSRLKDDKGNNNVSGIAYLGTIGSIPSYSYLIVTDHSGKVATTAHELGHSFGMPHLWDICDECDINPGLMCYEKHNRQFFFNQLSVDAALDHIRNYGGCLIDNQHGNKSELIKTWSNDRNQKWIGPWNLKANDIKLAGDFDGDGEDELLFVSSSNWSTMLKYSCVTGSDWYHKWSNMGNKQIGQWVMSSKDRHITGDFDGDGCVDILSISGSTLWSKIHRYNKNTNNWVQLWHNGGNGSISSWGIASEDKFITGDFDGDLKDELLCFSSKGWCTLLDFNNGQFTLKWSNMGNNYIGGVTASANYTYIPGNFTTMNQTELLTWVGLWVTLLRWDNNTNSWSWIWSQYGADNFADMYILPLNINQRILSGNFDKDSKDEILNINNIWSSSADWNGSGFQQNWNNAGSGKLSDWTLNTGTNEYMVIKPNKFNHDQIFSIKDACWANTYRFNDFNNKKMLYDDGLYSDNHQLELNNKILLYPNPTYDKVNLVFNQSIGESNINITVYNMTGKNVFSQSITSNISQFDFSFLSKGIYMICISDDKGFTEEHKIILQ